MAWKFRQERVAGGDVVEPSEFRINTNEFVSELNGFLDADNVNRQAIGKNETKRNTARKRAVASRPGITVRHR